MSKSWGDIAIQQGDVLERHWRALKSGRSNLGGRQTPECWRRLTGIVRPVFNALVVLRMSIREEGV